MERGQSATLGTVLLVSIAVAVGGTVAVYGTSFAADLADPAQVSLDAAQESGASQYESTAALQIEHGGGTALAPGDLSVVVDGERVANRSNLTVTYSAASFDVGERLVVEQTGQPGLTGGETVTLLYHDGDDTFELRSFTVEGGGPGADSAVFGFEGSEVGEAPNDPWNPSTDGPGQSTATVEVRENPTDPDQKALFLRTMTTGGGDGSRASASIDVNVTGVATIRVDYYDSEHSQIRINGSTRVGSINSGENWNTASVNVTGDSGTVTLTLYNKEQTNSETATVYFDDIRFYDDDGDRIAAEDVLP